MLAGVMGAPGRPASSRKPSSVYRGVHKRVGTEKWCAQLMKDGKECHLGYFEVEADAARTYDAKARLVRPSSMWQVLRLPAFFILVAQAAVLPWQGDTCLPALFCCVATLVNLQRYCCYAAVGQQGCSQLS